MTEHCAAHRDELYIVMGTCGEYSDRLEWPVAAYRDGQTAMLHAVLAERYAKKAYAEREQDPYNYTYVEALAKSNVYDPAMQFAYTGTTYFLRVVELRTELPDQP